jgi:hypothetical protein
MHQWSTTPINNGTADSRVYVPEGVPVSGLNNAIRGAMASAALWRDDNLGVALKATLTPNNVYTVTTGQGLVDPTTQVGGATPAITHPFSLKLTVDKPTTTAATTAPRLNVDGVDCGPILRRDGSAITDGDLIAGRVFEVLGDFAATSDTKVTRVRLLGITPGELQAIITPLIPAAPASTVPTGAAMMHLGTDIPTGFLLANGGLYSRTTYATLWAWAQANTAVQSESAWSSTYSGGFSSGDGTTNFRVPDFRGVFFRGLDRGRGIDANRALGTYQAHAFMDHYHGLNAPNAGVLGAGGGGYNYQNGGASAGSLSQYTTTSAYGGNVAGETRPSNVPVNVLIKY